MESQISSREEVEEILTGLGEQLNEPVSFLVIGGAAMLEYGLKDVTKDIDLVCRDAAGKARLLEAAKSLGFEVFGPGEEACSPGPGQGGHQGWAHPGYLRRPDLLRLRAFRGYVATWEDDPSPREGRNED
jgi:hypothetical protein